jgi:hypothetical protein
MSIMSNAARDPLHEAQGAARDAGKDLESVICTSCQFDLRKPADEARTVRVIALR